MHAVLPDIVLEFDPLFGIDKISETHAVVSVSETCRFPGSVRHDG